jgi:fatty-acid desaturase
MAEEKIVIEAATEEKMTLKEEAENFKFFKNCSSTLKKLSLAVFIVNLFLIVIGVVVGVIIAANFVGIQIIALLAVPIISVVAILVVFARLVSALIYGFAEIVEKHEK